MWTCCIVHGFQRQCQHVKTICNMFEVDLFPTHWQMKEMFRKHVWNNHSFCSCIWFSNGSKWHIHSVFGSQAEALTPALQAEMDVKEAIQLQQAENGEVVQIQMPGTWAARANFSRVRKQRYLASRKGRKWEAWPLKLKFSTKTSAVSQQLLTKSK